MPNTVYIPIGSNYGSHTVDFTFVPPQRSVDIVVGLVAGIEMLTFSGMTFGTAPLVVEVGPAANA